jgi:hypothetical protein
MGIRDIAVITATGYDWTTEERGFIFWQEEKNL